MTDLRRAADVFAAAAPGSGRDVAIGVDTIFVGLLHFVAAPRPSIWGAGETELGRLGPNRWRRKPRVKWVLWCCSDHRVPEKALRPSASWNATGFPRCRRVTCCGKMWQGGRHSALPPKR